MCASLQLISLVFKCLLYWDDLSSLPFSILSLILTFIYSIFVIASIVLVFAWVFFSSRPLIFDLSQVHSPVLWQLHSRSSFLFNSPFLPWSMHCTHNPLLSGKLPHSISYRSLLVFHQLSVKYRSPWVIDYLPYHSGNSVQTVGVRSNSCVMVVINSSFFLLPSLLSSSQHNLHNCLWNSHGTLRETEEWNTMSNLRQTHSSRHHNKMVKRCLSIGMNISEYTCM